MAPVAVFAAVSLSPLERPAEAAQETPFAEDCEPLLQALANARRQPQVAQFLVDADLRRREVLPLAFRIGDLVHEVEDGVMRTRRLGPEEDLLSDALRVEIASGHAWCRVEGVELFQGAQTTRISFRHPQVDAGYQPVTVLVDDWSGLPRWHGYAGMPGGFVWDYGVVPP